MQLQFYYCHNKEPQIITNQITDISTKAFIFFFRSVQNILLRYSLSHKLSVIVPDFGKVGNQLHPLGGAFNKPFDDSWLGKVALGGVPWHKTFAKYKVYDINALHCIWNHQKFRNENIAQCHIVFNRHVLMLAAHKIIRKIVQYLEKI